MLSDTFHDEYINRLAQWTRCRDAQEGEDAVHAKTVTYLPQLGDQDDDDYTSYLLRARWFNAFSKTISGYTGLVLRTPISHTAPEAMEEQLADVDNNGADLNAYIKNVLEEVLCVGRYGTLVEYPQLQEGATLADAQGARTYWVGYKTESILDWAYVTGKLVYVVLHETDVEFNEDYSKKETVNRFRVLKLIDGVYTQEVFLTDADGKNETSQGIVTPMVNSNTLNYIPFTLHEPDYLQSVNRPPLLDLVNLNFSHYRLKADHAHALHFVALPTPYCTGVDPSDEDAPSSIGPQKLWLIGNDSAKVGMLEYTGAGISSIKDELTTMEEQMAMLGARMLISEMGQAQTATAETIKSISETSDLASIVSVLSTQFNTLLKRTAEWEGHNPDDVTATINRDFLPPNMDAQMLLALVNGWLQGGYDYGTVFANLQKAEIIDQHMTQEDMQALIDTETAGKDAKEAEKIAAQMTLLDKQVAANGEGDTGEGEE